MVQQVVIRKAVASEVETLADIGYVAWERDLMPFLSGPAANRQNERRRLSQAVHELLDRTIVAEIDSVAVGWCARARHRAYIPFLFVTPLLQNHGIGSLLLRRMESMLELEGAERVHLDTLADNVRAVNFYQHQGYRILVLKSDGQANTPGSMSIRLEKRLAPFRGRVSDSEE
jgi:[ribosomal protein S18]-alanine N-acetyltransferase